MKREKLDYKIPSDKLISGYDGLDRPENGEDGDEDEEEEEENNLFINEDYY